MKNWYRQYKSAMPLPKVKNEYPPEMDRVYGLTSLDDQLSEEKANQLSEEGMEYLASGWYGSAFGFEGKNIVKKFTKDQIEIETAKEIMSRQNGNQALPGLVCVYEVKDLSADIFDYIAAKKNENLYKYETNKNLYQITAEKVQVLTEEQKKIFKTIYQDILSIVKRDLNIRDEIIINGLQKKYPHLTDVNIDINFIKMIVNFCRVIIKESYLDKDVHRNNVGIRNNNEIVILDLGSIMFDKEKFKEEMGAGAWAR